MILQIPTHPDSVLEPLKSHPRSVSLRMRRCPTCKTEFKKIPPLNTVGGVVQMRCPNTACGFSVPLFWIGDLPSDPGEPIEAKAIHISEA